MDLRTIEKISNQIWCFSLQQIQLYEPNFIRWNLINWHKKWYINRITKWWYTLSNFPKNEESLFFISNQIYKPSYISMESALRYYNLIPEWVFMTTACSSKKTQKLEWDRWVFYYYHIKSSLMWWYNIVQTKTFPFYIATVEKTLCDFFYLKWKMTKKDLEELRIDIYHLKGLTNKTKLLATAKQFKNKNVLEMIQLLISLF